MSYDISLTINTGVEEKDVVEIGNYTSNIGKMYCDAFNVQDWKFINGKVCKDALPYVKNACKNMRRSPDRYKKMEPSNGWGTYEGALEYLEHLQKGCEENPDCTVRISY